MVCIIRLKEKNPEKKKKEIGKQQSPKAFLSSLSCQCLSLCLPLAVGSMVPASAWCPSAWTPLRLPSGWRWQLSADANLRIAFLSPLWLSSLV